MSSLLHSVALANLLKTDCSSCELEHEEILFYYQLYKMEEDFSEYLEINYSSAPEISEIINEDFRDLAQNFDHSELKDPVFDFSEEIWNLILDSFPDSSLENIDKISLNDKLGVFLQSFVSCDFEMIIKFSEIHQIVNEEMYFYLLHVFRPFMIFLRKNSGQQVVKNSDLSIPRCPFCGYYADVATFSTNGEKKSLHCQLCDNMWDFDILACAICGNRDANTLGYFEVVDRDDVKVDYCDNCKAYLKTIIMDQKSEGDLVVKNLLSPSIDISAVEKGYLKP